MIHHGDRVVQASPAAQRRLAQRGYTRDAIPTIDAGPVHVHFHDQEELGSGSACEDILDRIDHLERAVVKLANLEGEEGLPDEDYYEDEDVQPGLSSSFEHNNSPEAAMARVQKEGMQRTRETLGHDALPPSRSCGRSCQTFRI
jgi:hypothetical protein